MELNSPPLSAIVVGGGIAGLAAAIGLIRTGWQVVVCERAPSLEPVGTGLTLWPNGLAALEALGLDEAVRGSGRALARTGLRRASGEWLSRPTSQPTTHSPSLVAVARPQLVDLLVGALPDGVVRLGSRVTDVRPGDGLTLAEVVCGTDTLRAHLVVAADGIGSAVRRRLWPDHPAAGYRGYTTWRALVEDDRLNLDAAATETWGSGDRFGIVPLNGRRTYVYATAAAPEGAHATSPAAELEALRRRFAGWHAPVPELLERLTAEALVRHDVSSLEPPVRHPVTGRVVLLGDAAHGMEPNLGQGACLALEDAVELTMLMTGSPVLAALDTFSAQRAARIRRLSRQSRLLGLVTTTRSQALTALRDAAVRCTPSALTERGLKSAARWSPPTPVVQRPPRSENPVLDNPAEAS